MTISPNSPPNESLSFSAELNEAALYRTQSSSFVAMRARRWSGCTHMRAMPHSILSISVCVSMLASSVRSSTCTCESTNSCECAAYTNEWVWLLDERCERDSSRERYPCSLRCRSRPRRTAGSSDRFVRVFTFVSLHKQLNGVVMPNSLSTCSRTCSAFFCSAAGDVQPIM